LFSCANKEGVKNAEHTKTKRVMMKTPAARACAPLMSRFFLVFSARFLHFMWMGGGMVMSPVPEIQLNSMLSILFRSGIIPSTYPLLNTFCP